MLKDEHTGLLLWLGCTFAGFGVAVGALRGVIERNHGSLSEWVSGIAAAALVALLLGWMLDAAGVPRGWQMPVVGMASYVAKDMLDGLKVVGAMFRRDPFGTLGNVVDGLRGRASRYSIGAPPAAPLEAAKPDDGSAQ